MDGIPSTQSPSRQPSYSRRGFLEHSTAGMLGLLAACAGLGGCVQRKDPPSPALVARKRGAWIDGHAHIFNAEDLDTYGYVEHGEGDNATRKVAFTVFAPLIKTLCMTTRYIAPDIERENWLLDKMLDLRAARRARQKRQGLAPASKGPALARELLQDLHTADAAKQEEVARAKKAFDDDLQRCLRGNGIGDGDKKAHPVRELMARIARGIKPSFFTCLANYRIYNALRLIENYPEMDAFVVASLDTDSWYQFGGPKTKPGERMMRQAQVMAKIAVLTEGQVIPRTGFCPLRQMLSGYAKPTAKAPVSPLEVLRCSVHHFGAIGAKLYPVLGYRPLGNRFMTNRELADLPMRKIREALRDQGELAAAAATLKDDEHTIGEGLDVALRGLYQLCLEDDISVMAHTNRSWGPAPFMNRIAPNWWQQVAEEFPRARVNLAHFGGFTKGRDAYGDMGQTAPKGRTGWPDEICQLLFRPEYPHFHADIACITPTEKISTDLMGILGDYALASRRLMYGSDWHEVLFPDGAPKYLGGWTEMFARHPELGRHTNDFFGGNAVRFHSLHGGKTRTRLDAFYQAHDVNPVWRRKVEGERVVE